MSGRDVYKARVLLHGETRRDRTINLAKQFISEHAAHSPAYKDMLVENKHQKLMVDSTEEDNKKRIKTMPYETIQLGALIIWNEMHWMVNSVDFDDEIYQCGFMVQCNRIVRWQNPVTYAIIERWCFCKSPYSSNINDGKMLSNLNGKYDIQLPYDSETIQVGIGKRLMLDIVGEIPTVYKLMFPDTNTNKYQDIEGGFITWTTASDVYNRERDNVELMICDYASPDVPSAPPEPPMEGLLKCEIVGRNNICIGGSPRKYMAKFYAADGVTETKTGISPIWEIEAPVGEKAFYKMSSLDDGSIKLEATSIKASVGAKLKLTLRDQGGLYSTTEYIVEAVSMIG